MGGFTNDEADTLAGPDKDGMRNGGLLKLVENNLNDEMATLRYDDVGRKVIPTLITRVTRALMEMSEPQARDPQRVLALLGPSCDFGGVLPAGRYATLAEALCRSVIERDEAKELADRKPEK